MGNSAHGPCRATSGASRPRMRDATFPSRAPCGRIVGVLAGCGRPWQERFASRRTRFHILGPRKILERELVVPRSSPFVVRSQSEGGADVRLGAIVLAVGHDDRETPKNCSLKSEMLGAAESFRFRRSARNSMERRLWQRLDLLEVLAMPFRFDPHHWRDRAEEMRRLAKATKDEGTKQMMLRVADEYDDLAASTANNRGRLIAHIAHRVGPLRPARD